MKEATQQENVDTDGETRNNGYPSLIDMEMDVTIKQLFEARVHLGHKHGVWNPLMNQYLIGTRCGMDIFDLDVTLSHLKLALNVAGNIARRNGIILFVNERTQFDRLIRNTASDCGEYACTPKWRPGTLTNSQMLLKTMRLPDLMIFTSIGPSATALRESVICNVPSIGVVDSDRDPRLVTYVIPGNDDTPSAVKLYCQLFHDVIKKAKNK
jgi:small subunit ribosomal protein S2